jgi:hypothetical protein
VSRHAPPENRSQLIQAGFGAPLETISVDFAGTFERHFVDEVDLSGNHLRREVAGRECHEFCRGNRGILAKLHERVDFLPEFLVANSDDTRFRDIRMGTKDGFDFERRNVAAATPDSY